MPRCLMPKKWKTAVANECSWEYDGRRPCSPPVPQQPTAKHSGPQWEPPVTVLLHHHQPHHHPQQQHHHHAWGPSSPPAGATAPSPPPCCTGTAFHYLTEYAGAVKSEYPTQVVDAQVPPSAAAMQSAAAREPQPVLTVLQYQRPRTYTSTGVALSLPPKKKDIYRPYSLDDHKPVKWPRPEEDISAAQAILDLSASTPVVVRPPPPPLPLSLPPPQVPTLTLPLPPPPPPPPAQQQQQQQLIPSPLAQRQPQQQQQQQQSVPAVERESRQQPVQQLPVPPSMPIPPCAPTATSKTVAYTYEAFFVSDGRSKRKSSAANAASTGSGDECVSGGEKSNGPTGGGVGAAGPTAAVGAEFGAASPGRPSKYTCSECGKRYATSSNLSRHKQTHRSLDSQSAKRCNVCGKPYVSMPALAMHQLTHKLTHACAVCGKMFSRPWLLQGHLRSHTGEKPYGCAHCGKAFADRSNLRAHMQTHSGDKNFACPRCFKSFALKSYLNKHLESACIPANSAATPSSPSSSTSSVASSSSSACSSPTHHQHPQPQHVHDHQQHHQHSHTTNAEITNLNLLRPTVLHTA